MTAPEFEEEVNRALDDNPALERDDDSALLPLDDSGLAASSFNETAEQIQLADYRGDDEMPTWRVERRAAADNSGRSLFESLNDSQQETLYDHLRQQLAEQPLTPRAAALGDYLIGDIDDNGYLTRTPNQIANDLTFNMGIDTSASEIESLVEIVKGFDPPGVGASSLSECLELQLKADTSHPAQTVADALKIIAEHFELFTRKHFDRIAQAASISPERVTAAVALLRSLNPKPGATFGRSGNEERLKQIMPDFEVEPDGNGRMSLSMNSNIPQLRIEASFDIDNISVQGQRRLASDASAFIKRKHDEAATFIKTVKMRQETLWNVMTAILKFQKRFFETGNPTDLKPMILKEISAMTGYDLSVVSRATSGKYIATPHGTYPLKFFFNEKPKETVDASTHQILEVIKQIIESEDKRHPLSDEALASELSKRGFDIARRTVTKYRERLGYSVARLRREL